MYTGNPAFVLRPDLAVMVEHAVRWAGGDTSFVRTLCRNGNMARAYDVVTGRTEVCVEEPGPSSNSILKNDFVFPPALQVDVERAIQEAGGDARFLQEFCSGEWMFHARMVLAGERKVRVVSRSVNATDPPSGLLPHWSIAEHSDLGHLKFRLTPDRQHLIEVSDEANPRFVDLVPLEPEELTDDPSAIDLRNSLRARWSQTHGQGTILLNGSVMKGLVESQYLVPREGPQSWTEQGVRVHFFGTIMLEPHVRRHVPCMDFDGRVWNAGYHVTAGIPWKAGRDRIAVLRPAGWRPAV